MKNSIIKIIPKFVIVMSHIVSRHPQSLKMKAEMSALPEDSKARDGWSGAAKCNEAKDETILF